MSKEIPTPYVWTYQPQSGTAAGASQDYSTQMNWLSAGNSMIRRVNQVRDVRNGILLRQGAITETERPIANPPSWPAFAIMQPDRPLEELQLPRDEGMERLVSNQGMQIAGGGAVGDKTAFYGDGFQMPTIPRQIGVRSDGLFQLAGGGPAFVTPHRPWLLMQTNSTVPRSGGIGEKQFLQEFPPSVYLYPYSGCPSVFPSQFIHHYDVVTDTVDNYS